MHLTLTTINAGQDYTAQLSERATVGEVARYMARFAVARDTDAGTLELARPVRFDALLRDIGYQSGDRLLMFTQTPRRAELPPPLRKGDRILRFTSGAYEVTSKGKRSLLLGKPDDTQQIIPDVDLRYFVPQGVRPQAQEFISRSCLWLNYEEHTRTWYATRMGHTRVTLDDFELGESRIPLNDAQRLRFYRATDEPLHGAPPLGAPPLGEMTVRIETVQGDDEPVVDSGSFSFVLRMGAEREPQHLNASENLRIGQIVSSLAVHNRTTLTEETRVYHMQLLAPHLPLHNINLSDDAFLYTAMGGFYASNEIHLRDVHAPENVYRIPAGFQDDESLIGCSMNPYTPDASLDVDLYNSTVSASMSPTTRATLARQARVFYRSRENTWWIRLDEQARVPVFVNNNRVTPHTPLPLMSGDVVSIGTSVNHYFLRLEIELVSRL